ncbi:aminotransferase class I/II-fold pyridoxal phosphate-dependent enzyme [Companilactobacillus mishanensis]|uniref:aminotransferase class I/II-fold pyridoxal phosphate-dependent enzyme n=1 Tax=Companilactobacillus mishanensis TaxID=2486008 RepID=UPI001295D62C|nr:aminotransferase class I/II-fold pyridoxal phosphate-dependent enzyme [Companilactobacillus mishanensis]MQS89130.1 aminotransferase class I/II-fold pyridoxal phosphate-dependent enzyme [Companilactobacillus mishanensis]
MKNPIELMNPEVVAIKQQEIFKFNALAKSNPGVINMTVGEPNFPTPDHIKLAAIKAIEENDTRYTVPEGDHELLSAASKYLHDKYDLNYDPNTEMITTLGVTEGVFSTLNAVLSAGDEILIPAPCYTIYGPDSGFDRATPVYLDTSKSEFKVTPEQLNEILSTHPKIKAFLFNYPTNPTGVSYTRPELEKLADVLRKYDIFVISDEIYSELTYKFKHYSLAKLLPDQTILLNGLSKSHSMTGWRIGIACGPKAIIAEINKIHELATTAVSTISQAAATEAYKNGFDDTKPMLDEYRKRRDVLLSGLEKLDFYCPIPDGAFYLFAKIPEGLNQDDVAMAKDLLNTEGLAILPGSFFGEGGAGHLRLSYAASMDSINGAIEKLGDYVKEHKNASQSV